MGCGVFRGLQIRRTNDTEELPHDLSLEELRHETGMRSGDTMNNGTPSQGRLFTIQAMISELNQETPRGIIVDEDLVIQDIELDSVETSPSTDHVNMSETEIQKNAIGCVTPSPVISDLDQETPRQCNVWRLLPQQQTT